MTRNSRVVLLLPAMCLLALAVGACSAPATPPAEAMVGTGATPSGRQITRRELQQRLMAFADRYLSRISEATDQLKFGTTDPQRRLSAHATKYYPATTVLTVAADRDPEAALLNMLTVVTLERMVWHYPDTDGWAAQRYGSRQAEELASPSTQPTSWAVAQFGADGARILKKAQREAEDDIWTCAAAVLPDERLEEVWRVIEDWRIRNPDNRYVATMRFDDFVAAQGELSQRAQRLQTTSGGFLAPINEATRAVDETRLLGERFMFLTGRISRVMSWQAELLVYELAGTPEVRQTMDTQAAIADSLRRYAKAAEGMPDVLAREREALLEDVGRESKTIEGLIESTRAALAEAKPVSADLRQTAASAERIAAELRATVREAGPMMETIARLSGKGASSPAAGGPSGTPAMTVLPSAAQTRSVPSATTAPTPAGQQSPPPPQTPTPVPTAAAAASGRPFDITEYERFAREMRALIESSDALLQNKAWQTRIDDINRAADARVLHVGQQSRELIDYAFFRGIFFAVFFCFLLFLTALIYRLTIRRLHDPHRAEGAHAASMSAPPTAATSAPLRPDTHADRRREAESRSYR